MHSNALRQLYSELRVSAFLQHQALKYDVAIVMGPCPIASPLFLRSTPEQLDTPATPLHSHLLTVTALHCIDRDAGH